MAGEDDSTTAKTPNQNQNIDHISPHYLHPSETPLTENFAGNVRREGKWIVDSGASEHITHRQEWTENKVRTLNEKPVIIPNGLHVPVEGKWTCNLPNGLKIENILHVPKFTCNLLSVSRLAQDLQCTVTFFPTFCAMQDLATRRLIGAGKYTDGLYEMDMVGSERKALMVTMDTWHMLLGHASREKLSRFDFIEFPSKTGMSFCDSCVKAKHKRLLFPISSIKTKDCIELLHCDIWGKYRTPSLTQARYFLTIVDDYSRGERVMKIDPFYLCETFSDQASFVPFNVSIGLVLNLVSLLVSLQGSMFCSFRVPLFLVS